MKKTLAILAAVLSFNAHANEKLIVGATPVPHAEILEFVKPTLAKEGVDLDIKVFTDFIQLNQQLALKNIEFLVARPDNINDPGLQKLAKALNSDEVRQFILTRYKGQIAPGF